MATVPHTLAGGEAVPGGSREALRVGSTVHAIAITLLVACLVTGAAVVTLADPAVRLLALGIVGVAAGLAMLLVRRGEPRAGSLVIVVTLYVAVTGGLFAVGSIYAPSIVGYPIIVMAAGLLLGSRSAILTAGLSMAAIAILAVQQPEDALASVVATHTGASVWWIQCAAVGAASTMICVAVRRTEDAFRLSQIHEAALIERNDELEREVGTRRKVESALRESDDRYRRLAENVHEIIAEYDRDAGLLYVSPSIRRVMGYSPDEMTRSDLFSKIHPEDLDQIGPALHDAFEKRQPVELTIRAQRADGSWREIEASTQTFESATGSLRVVGIARDVTERRELELQLREAQKLEAVARLAGGIAHDFNNLLTVVTGHIEILLDRDNIDDEQHQALIDVRVASERAAALVQHLLAFSRSQARDPRIVDLNATVHHIGAMLRPLIGEHVELRIRTEEGPLCVHADSSQIEQLLVNLALNARDAIRGTGQIVVETGRQCGSQRSQVFFSVADDGVGMSDETRERVFEPFFTTKQAGRGTGLGLSTVHGIVEQSGGSIEVESTPGVGSTFRVLLPEVEGDPAEEAPAIENGEAPLRGAETVLIVEDEDAVRTLARRFLEQRGYSVLEACNGAEAIRVAHAHGGGIDLLLTDVVMPVMGGVELQERLAAEGRNLPTLFMSGYWEHPDGSPPNADVVRRTIGKPFRPKELALRVREAIDASG